MLHWFIAESAYLRLLERSSIRSRLRLAVHQQSLMCRIDRVSFEYAPQLPECRTNVERHTGAKRYCGGGAVGVEWSSGGWCGGKWGWSNGAVGGDGDAVGGGDGVVVAVGGVQ